MQVVYKDIKEIKEYKNNPRKNEDAVDYVANSIKEFGFKVPIIIDKNNEIVAGHTRYKASLKLGLTQVPCIISDDLTDKQVKAFRIIDNKVAEYSAWDYMLLDDELKDITTMNMEEYGFTEEQIDWGSVDDLTEQNYEEPEDIKCQCPYCNHIDIKWRFGKVNEE